MRISNICNCDIFKLGIILCDYSHQISTMQTTLILSLMSDDKPGIVEALASALETHGGNWLESRLVHLDGKFAGVVRVAVEEDKRLALLAAFDGLRDGGLDIHCDLSEKKAGLSDAFLASFSAVGPDRNGIIKELSRALSHYHINVEELESNLSSMPYSGEPIFEASGTLSVPARIDIRDLQDRLFAIADELGIDIDVEKR